jgi:uncharacterized RmlC-like cupin family protein
MTEEQFLDGKVIKRSLPVFQNSPPRDVVGPKRLLLAQGELANFYDGDEGIRYLALVELRVGQIRGNHFHRVKEEQIYIISGEVQLVTQSGDENMRVFIELRPGDLVSIATAVEFSKTRFDASDVERFQLV